MSHGHPTKTCACCGHAKLPSDFAKDRSRKDGRMNRCKACDNARTRARYRALTAHHPPRRCAACDQPTPTRSHGYCDPCRARLSAPPVDIDVDNPPPECPICNRAHRSRRCPKTIEELNAMSLEEMQAWGSS